jgi:hypothetical protein
VDSQRAALAFRRIISELKHLRHLSTYVALEDADDRDQRRRPFHAASPCRKRFGTLEAADVKRLRQLKQENGRLKKLLAERDLDIELLKEVSRKKS